MRSSRDVLTLGYSVREEVEPGVWEKAIVLQRAKATRQKVFQSRQDQAYREGMPITARFVVRSTYPAADLDYVEHDGKRYKVRTVTPDLRGHFMTIELGELM